MTADEVKTALAKAARRCWPDVAKASDLPFPDYWKAVTEWLMFHSPHVGDALMWKLIDEYAVDAKKAEEQGRSPVAPKVTDAVRQIWANVQPAADGTANVQPAADGNTEPAAAEACFVAPFSSPGPRALKKAKKKLEQGSLGSW